MYNDLVNGWCKHKIPYTSCDTCHGAMDDSDGNTAREVARFVVGIDNQAQTEDIMTKKPPRKFTVTAEVTISMLTEVVATSAEEAIEKAQDHGMVSLCYQCSRGEPTEEWVTSGELDGEPVNFRIEHVDEPEEDVF